MLDPVSKMLLSGAGRRGPVVLMYHSVEPGGRRPAWHWAVSQRNFEAQLDLLASGGWHSHTVAELGDGGQVPERSVILTFDDGYRDNFAAFAAIAERGMRGTLFMVSGDVGGRASWGVDPNSGRAMLDRGELKELLAAGMEIGCHTRAHSHLTALGDARLREEVVDSRKELQDLLDDPITSFAYPFGDHDDRVVEAVRQAGYRTACVTRSGWGRVDDDPLRIRRIAVFASDSVATFARKLAFADNEAGWARVGSYYFSRLRSRLTT